jgi:hypothetical protein
MQAAPGTVGIGVGGRQMLVAVRGSRLEREARGGRQGEWQAQARQGERPNGLVLA